MRVIFRKDILVSFLMRNVLVPILIIFGFWMASCQKENISTDPSLKLSFNTDTLLFDTVFTTIGSATRYFKVYNPNRSDVVISSVRLAGGNGSAYRMNVDGEATSLATSVSLRSKDSLFVFVEVNVDPTNLNSPLLIPDSIIFETNGNRQDVKLVAWGQDVHLLNADTISSSTVFFADKPYLIYNYLWVQPNAELSISAGARLHFHNFSHLVVDGTLKVNGEPENPVIFEGDRLEQYYRDKAGQWNGIYMRAGSHSNEMNWAVVKNAINGVVIDTFAFPGVPSLIINNSRVENMSSSALWGRGAIIEAGNSLFASSGHTSVALMYGGSYRFNHCTIANYWGQYTNRQGPALLLNNYYTYKIEGSTSTFLETRDMEEAYFGNCIIFGSRANEIEVDNIFNGQVVDALMNYTFENSILGVDERFDLTDISRFINVITDNPKFLKPFDNNFELDTLSPAKDMGLYEIALQYPFDLNNVSRLNDNGPDIGAFERVEEP